MLTFLLTCSQVRLIDFVLLPLVPVSALSHFDVGGPELSALPMCPGVGLESVKVSCCGRLRRIPLLSSLGQILISRAMQPWELATGPMDWRNGQGRDYYWLSSRQASEVDSLPA